MMLTLLVGTAAMAADPALIGGCLVAGLASPRWWVVVLAAAVVALLIQGIVASGRTQFGEPFEIFNLILAARLLAALVWAMAFYGLGRWFRRF